MLKNLFLARAGLIGGFFNSPKIMERSHKFLDHPTDSLYTLRFRKSPRNRKPANRGNYRKRSRYPVPA